MCFLMCLRWVRRPCTSILALHNAFLLQYGNDSSCAQRRLSLKISLFFWAPLLSRTVPHRILTSRSLNRALPLTSLLINCIKKLSSICSNNPDCFCPPVLAFQKILVCLSYPTVPRPGTVWPSPPALRRLHLSPLVDEQVYSRNVLQHQLCWSVLWCLPTSSPPDCHFTQDSIHSKHSSTQNIILR